MIKILLAAIVSLTLFACNDPKTERLFPRDQLIGAVENIQVKIDPPKKGKMVKGGMLVNANVLLPPDIKNEQVRPTELSVLKQLKEKYPQCEWFLVWFSDDIRIFDAGHYLGQAKYREGKIELQGGVITDKDVSDFDNKIWKPTEVDKKLAYEFFQINQSYERKHQTELLDLQSLGRWDEAGELSLVDPITDSAVYAIVAQNLGLSSDEVSRRVRNVYECYSLVWGRKL